MSDDPQIRTRTKTDHLRGTEAQAAFHSAELASVCCIFTFCHKKCASFILPITFESSVFYRAPGMNHDHP